MQWIMHTVLLLLLLGGVHGERVHEGTGDGDRRTDDGAGGHGSLEGDDGRDDDDDALDGVADGVGDGVDLLRVFVVGFVRCRRALGQKKRRGLREKNVCGEIETNHERAKIGTSSMHPVSTIIM